jgi:hypothetical protein
MTGSEGMGAMPSSRLTRLLQEKAEALRKRRQTAEAEAERADGLIRRLAEVGIVVPDVKERQEKILEWQRKSDWEAAENEAKELIHFIEASAAVRLGERRWHWLERAERLRALAPTSAESIDRLIAQGRDLIFGPGLGQEIDTFLGLADELARAEAECAEAYRAEVERAARWTGLSDAEWAVLQERLEPILRPITAGEPSEALTHFSQTILELLPQAAETRERNRREAGDVVELAREIGYPATDVEAALAADESATPGRWGETGPAIGKAIQAVQGELRARVIQAIDYLDTTLASLREHGADPTSALEEIGRLRARAEQARAFELGALLSLARAAAEEPVVGVVAGLLDEVRPKLVEARELGRDPSEVFAAMNRAREAMRLKLYGDALAASVEAIDRVGQLTIDLDAARDEAEGLGRILGRLEPFKLATAPFRQALVEASDHLDRLEIEPARAILRDTLRALGRESARYFGAEVQRLTTAAEIAEERGFLPEGVRANLEKARAEIDAGTLPEAGESLALADVALREAAAPYVARRVEEMRRGFQEIRDQALAAGTLRSLADADLALRVKDDVTQSLESLRQAERQFSAAFAAESSALLEALDEREHVLEEMGGAGSEFLRQSDEIQQIFDLGDFVRSALAAREFLAATEGTQRTRAEEAISHAKLQLVELAQQGLEPPALRTRFESAQQDLAAGRLVEAYRGATAVQTEAARRQAAARAAAGRLAEVKDQLLELEREGIDALTFQEELSAAETAYRGHDFERVRAAADQLADRLVAAVEAARIRRMIAETDQLAADAVRLGVPVEDYDRQIAEARAALDAEGAASALGRAQAAHQAIVRNLAPVLSENLRTIEEDYEVARAAGVELGPLSATLAEARRRLALPVPVGVAERIEAARTQLAETRGFVEHANREAQRVAEAFGQAELLHLVTAPMRAEVLALERAIEDRRYARAIEIAGPLEREIRQATAQHVTRTVAGLQGMLVRARQDGIPTTAAEAILAQARSELGAGRPIEAIQLAAQSEGEVERIGLQTRVAQGALETLEQKLAHFTGEQLKAPRAAALARDARAAFDRADFTTSIELAFESIDELAQEREVGRKARDAIEIAARQVKEAIARGAEDPEVEAVLAKARELAEEGEYPAASARARVAADLARGALERRYASGLANARALLETARGLELAGTEPVAAALERAEASFQAKAWALAEEAFEAGRAGVLALLDRALADRMGEIERRYGSGPAPPPPEVDRRSAWRETVSAAQARGAYADAFKAVAEEERHGRESTKTELEKRVSDLKDRLWVGERLGLDTTPAMQRFSEARAAVDQGQFEAVSKAVDQGLSALDEVIQAGLATHLRQVETELHFARDGLHVQLGDLAERLANVQSLAANRELVAAGRLLLSSEEELERRKSYQRELANVFYLIEAGLRRAADARLDTTEARRRFDASTREAARDYPAAIEQARAALKLLEGMLKSSEPSTAFWPFKRPPSASG